MSGEVPRGCDGPRCADCPVEKMFTAVQRAVGVGLRNVEERDLADAAVVTEVVDEALFQTAVHGLPSEIAAVGAAIVRHAQGECPEDQL